MINEHFIFVGMAASFAGGALYILNTLKGKTKPNRVTWGLWAVAPLIAFAAELQKGVGLPALMTFTVGFVPLMVFIASFVNRQAEWRLTKFDITCGVLSVLGLICWLLTGEGNLAIAFAIMADGLAALPTLVKAYKYPETEVWYPYMAGIFNGGIALLTINGWSFAHYGFPVYIIAINVLLVLFVRFSPGLSAPGREASAK